MMRTEKDFIGEMKLPEQALYGIHSLRAKNNFPNNDTFQFEWYKSIARVKEACYKTVVTFRDALEKEHLDILKSLSLPRKEHLNALITAAQEVGSGLHFEHFIVPAVQGGAGTSINLNMNEIITNRALQILEKTPGDYSTLDPIEAANIYQSTNDVIPTALVVACMEMINKLEEVVNLSRQSTENLEKKYNNSLRITYTQLQEAVPGTYGQLFSTYSDALSRDWWRISKVFERIKQVNLGGGATGTAVGIPRFFLMEVVNQLRKITSLPLAQSENLADRTANQDAFVEVHAILKAHAVNLEKMVSDLRLLSSGISGNKELKIPAQQTGSSIMPGKVNPVIPEFVISAAHKIYSNDLLISSLAGQGNLDLNAYLPSIGHAILESIKLLISMNETIVDKLLNGLTIDVDSSVARVYKSPSITTALSPLIGYHKSAELASYMKKHNTDIFEANKKLKLVSEENIKKLMEPNFLLKKGWTVKDIQDFKME